MTFRFFEFLQVCMGSSVSLAVFLTAMLMKYHYRKWVIYRVPQNLPYAPKKAHDKLPFAMCIAAFDMCPWQTAK